MRITLNHRQEELSACEPLTVAALLAIKRYSFPNIIVRINGSLIKRDAYASALIREGDQVEMIHMVSGG